ncbi:TPR-like protein [Dioscorea alata]|uniref:TPR-like protein n=1 Tax=Dioscorea alata TaxID=55571 RepID=A0ACB7UZU7_DIOAL|nr:TPR-like protein [Dioscorea alata]
MEKTLYSNLMPIKCLIECLKEIPVPQCSDLGGRGQREGNFGLFKSMVCDGLRLETSEISCLIGVITGAGSETMKLGVHCVVIKSGFESETCVATALIGFYSALNDLRSAKHLFCQVHVKDLILWSAMVSAYCKNGLFFDAIHTFAEMQDFGVCPNSVTLLSVLLACANTASLRCGKPVHCFSIRRGFDSETSLQNALVDMYVKCSRLETSMIVFDFIKQKDIISWKSIIIGCIEFDKVRKAVMLFSKMRASQTEPDEIIIRNIISMCACSQTNDFMMFGFGMHGLVIKSGLSTSTSVGTALLRMYAEFKEVETVETLFEQLEQKDIIAWSAMISVYAHSENPVLALEMFNRMKLSNIEANEITLVSLLQACSSLEAFNIGRSIHARLTRTVYSLNLYTASALIDFYCKIGKLSEGKALFNRLKNKDLVSWSSMIKGYGINGCGEEAIGVFLDMLEHGIKPNEVVFISLLSACSHCGMVDQGLNLFNAMEHDYSIKPTPAHYACIVDMLGRQGDVAGGLKFITSRMQIKPDVNVWGTLLSWCRVTANGDTDTKVAEIAAEQLMKLDPDNPSYYVLLSNMYSEIGKWEDAERIRLLIDEKWLRKSAGISMV